MTSVPVSISDAVRARADVEAADLWLGAVYPPRKWQRAAMGLAMNAAMDPKRRGIIEAVMGAGKSIFQAQLVANCLGELGSQIIVSAPTEKLVNQLGETMAQRLGRSKVGLYYGKRKQPHRPVVVACTRSLSSLAHDIRRPPKLWVADECHGTEAEGVRNAITELAPERAIGFTATPFRSSNKESLQLWNEHLYHYRMADALKDGVLVPFRTMVWQGEEETPLDEACTTMIREHGNGPGIVSAFSIEDAEMYSEVLNANGIASMAIHSKLSNREQDHRLQLLRTGELGALVHVSLLAEGVDLPWLRWLCLRRNVGARVRFCQEVGRVLRVDREDPTKTHAIVFDPLNLLAVHGLSHAAAIGEALQEEAERVAALEADGEDEEEFRAPKVPVAVAVSAILNGLQTLKLDLELRAPQWSSTAYAWNDNDGTNAKPTERQLQTVTKMAYTLKQLPTREREWCRRLAETASGLHKRAVSELLDIMFFLEKRRRAYKEKGKRPARFELQFPIGDDSITAVHSVVAA